MVLSVIIAIITVIIILGAIFIIAMYKQAFSNHILHHQVKIKELPSAFNKYKVFFISDIHRRVVEKALLDQLTDAPDIIVIGGDLAEEGVPFSRIEKNLSLLSAIAPLYFVWGNHDLFLNETVFRELLADYNVRILENSTEQLHKDGEVINLSGVHDVTNEREDLDKTLENRVPSPTILISHNPDIKHQLAYRDDVDLVLSGHTHGGQVRLFGFGIRESGGVKQYNFGPLIISNGYGTTRWPIRWGAKPDALVITLECER